MADISIDSLAGSPILIEGERATFIISNNSVLLLILINFLGNTFFCVFRPIDQLRSHNEPGSLEQRPLVLAINLLTTS